MAAIRPECGICMDSFKNPKLISCHHSFCYKCLEDYVRVNLCNGRFDCPVCRTNVELPKDVPGFKANVYIDTDSGEKGPSIRTGKRDFADGSNYVDLTPRYVWSGGSSRSGGVSRRASGQRGRGGFGGSTSQRKHINFSMQKDIKLHHAKEAWKPTHRTDKMDRSEVDIKSEELSKKVGGILNKLTPQNFQTLVAKMQALEIDTELRLKHVIDIVFEKAIRDPKYSEAYANMCRCLSMFKMPAERKQGDVNFRALLLRRCQREFEKANFSKKELDSKRKEIEKAAMEEEKQQMNEELEHEETKAKMRSLGNIRFIGELFKLKMLTENIMHDCVFKLLQTKDEDNMECLSILLKTIGKKLETDKAKPQMDQYFTQMQKIINEKKLSSKVHFMLQDVIELRRDKWVPRRDDNPKTIDQIHREVAQEEKDQAIFKQNLPQAKPQKGSHGRLPGQPSDPMVGGADSWNTVSQVPLWTDRSVNPTKLKLSNLSNNENIQLDPGVGVARLGWFKGSTGGGVRFQEGERSNTPGNRFSAVRKADKSNYDGSHVGGRGGFGRPGPPVNRPSEESEREKAIAAAKTIVAQRPFEERSGGHEPEHAMNVEKPSIPVLELTDDQMGSKTRAIMDEFLHIQDVGEVMLCVQKLSTQGNLHLFVYNALNQVLETSEVARRQTGLLLHYLVKHNVILVDTYVKGLNEVLMYVIDMEIDIPKIWEYLAQLISPMLQDDSVPLGFLKEVCEPLRANSKSGILVAEILHDASHREGHEKVARLWAESGLHWSDFVPNDQIDQFLADKGKWVPRSDDQIHREVAQEAQDRAISVQNVPQTKPQKGSCGRFSGQPSGPMGGGADGWNTVYPVPPRTDQTIDPMKLKLSKFGDSENIQLGLGGVAVRLGWFKGSIGDGARSEEGERPNTPGNRFSAWSKADKSEDDGSRRGVGRRGFGQPWPSVKRPSQESEREKAIAAAKTIVAQRPSEERSGGREPERAKTMEKPFTPVQELMDDQMGSKTRVIMDEYLRIQDVGKAISHVQELSSSSCLHLFVYNALNQVLERSEVTRRQTGLLLHDLVKQNVILVDTYVKGLNEILMYAEDMEIDIPKIWEYFGQLIGPMVLDGSVPLGFLKQVCEPLRANSKSGILVAEILHDASHREGHKKVARLWAESGLHWSDFVPENQIDQFLADKKLEFTQVGNSAPTSPTTSMAIPMIEESLNNLITNRNCSNEEVFDWIEGQVDELTVKQEHFIRALMTAVCRSAVTVSSNNLMKVDKSHIQKRNNLLQKYLDHQVNFELQALFALQALVHKLEHPPGVLQELFDILYDEDIISEDAFIQWEKNEDPQEQQGKGVAMKQVVLFFTWLKQAEDDAES